MPYLRCSAKPLVARNTLGPIREIMWESGNYAFRMTSDIIMRLKSDMFIRAISRMISAQYPIHSFFSLGKIKEVIFKIFFSSFILNKLLVSFIFIRITFPGVYILQKYEFYSPVPPRRVQFFFLRFCLKSAKKGSEKFKT